MSAPSTLLFDGHDLRAMTGIRVLHMELFAPGRRRGSNAVIQGRPGEIGAELPYAAYSFSVGIRVFGATREDMITNLRALGTALAGTNGLGTLTRRLATTGGYDEHTANGQFVDGLGLTLLNSFTGKTELQFVNLDGFWTSAGSPGVEIVP